MNALEGISRMTSARTYYQAAFGPSPDTSNLALKSDIPTPATAAPPGVADVGSPGSDLLSYALSNHTHASKARKVRAQCDAAGLLNWTFDVPFASGVIPRVLAVAETVSGVTDVVNVQVEGTPSNTGCTLRVTRTNRSTVALLGLTILSLPASVGVTWVHGAAFEQ